MGKVILDMNIRLIDKDFLSKNINIFQNLVSKIPDLNWSQEQLLLDLPYKWKTSVAAIKDNEIVAFSFNSVKKSALHIHAFFVIKECRSSGVSKLLMKHIIKIKEKHNLTSLTLRVDYKNKPALIFYLKQNFVIKSLETENSRLFMSLE